MSNLDKLLNNYCVLQVLKNYAKLSDKDEIIFSNFEELLFFIDEIRADEREACAKLCESIERNGAWITKEEAAAVIRMRGNHDALDRMVADIQRMGLYDDAVNMSEERIHKTDKREQEPVCFLMETAWNYEIANWGDPNGFPVYTAPPKKEWVGLTDEEVFEFADTNLYEGGKNYGILSFGKAIEAKLKEKNQ